MNFALNNQTIKWLVFAIILIFALGLRIYYQSDKTQLFEDEIVSFELATINPHSWGAGTDIMNDSTKFVADDLYKSYFQVNPSFGALVTQLSKLRINTHDSSHPNLYYSLLRTSFLGVQNNDVDTMIDRAFYLNLLLFIFSFILLYKLANRIFNNDILILCVLGVAFLNPASVANTLFLRPYQVQETIFILFTYISVIYFLKIINGESFNKWKFIISFGLVTSLMLLTGYFSIGYILLILVLFIFFIVKFSSPKNIWFLPVSIALGCALTPIFYLKYFKGFLSFRGEEVLEKFSFEMFLNNIKDRLDGLINNINIYYWDIFVLLIIAAVILFLLRSPKIKSANKSTFYISVIPLLLFSCGLIWVLVIYYFAPYIRIRYVVAILPIISLLIPFILSFCKTKIQVFFSIIFILYFGYKTMTTPKNQIYLEYFPIDEVYQENKELPLVLMALREWNQQCAVPYYKDGERTVEFAFDSITLKNKVDQYDELFLFLPPDSLTKYKIPNGYQIDKELTAFYLKMYRLKRKK